MIGRLVTKRQASELYGGNCNAGIDYDQTQIRRILAKHGSKGRYANEVKEGKLYYCFSPDKGATHAMQRAYEQGSTFPVFCVEDGSTETRFFVGKIESVSDRYTCSVRRRTFHRYVIAPILECVCDAPIETTAPPFDSLLEARHYACMTALGMSATRQVQTKHDLPILLDKSVSYTPDFSVVSPSNQRYVVEIKPCYPYEIQVRRCMQYASSLPEETPVVLLYNTCFRCPFQEGSLTGVGDYSHAAAVRGMLFRREEGGVRIHHDVAYFSKEEGGKVVDSGFRRFSHTEEDEPLFFNASLQAAYETARLVKSF